MTANNSILKFVLVLLAALLPGLVFAAGDAAPAGATDWDMYVYGNGRVVYDILNGIKMLMVPEAGETGFRSLLLVLATLGFVILAVAAGFDPSKNLLKMFTYLLMIWGVLFASTGITSNVVINDMARAPASTGSSDEFRVTGAPAIVVIPAALTSAIGMYFTEAIETYYSMPGEFKMAGGAVGQFNLFGKMMTEATQYRITSPELKRSLSSYVTNCVVPAMSLGKLEGKGKDLMTGLETPIYGTEALLRSTDMTATLASAVNKAILVPYYPYSTNDRAWVATAAAEATDLGGTEADHKQYAATGVLVSCTTAWSIIAADLNKYADRLVEASADAWTRAGIMTPFETAMSSMLGQASAPGGMIGANFSRPSGFTLQTAMTGAMNGSFRQAAIHTGNNELMQAVAVSQAEAMQKSAWASSFAVFNNMMGYVFTVLQAFIFALTPFIVVALFIPGMGKAIFLNYAQVLVWLTLWQPMLSIINFIMLVFGSESISGAVATDGGITMSNAALISERTSDLMVAAGFLGTMTPLLSWGIVKGAMAFTEFISAGVGSQFASQAGASAATGNISMGNLSMDNTSMNKYSTQMSSAVGYQPVQAGLNAGALDASQGLGGSSTTVNGGAATRSNQSTETLQSQLSEAKTMGEALTASANKSWSMSALQSASRGEGVSHQTQMAAQRALSHMDSVGTSSGTSNTETANKTLGNKSQATQSADAGEETRYGATVAGKVGTPAGKSKGKNGAGGDDEGGGMGASASLGGQASRNKSSGVKDSVSEAVEQGAGYTSATNYESGSIKHSKADGLTNTFSHATTDASTSDQSTRSAQDESAQISRAFQSAISENNAIIQSLTKSLQTSSGFTANSGMSAQTYNSEMSDLMSLRAEQTSGLAGAVDRASGMQSAMGAHQSDVDNRVGGHMDRVAGDVGRSVGPGGGGSPFDAAAAGYGNLAKNADTQIHNGGVDVDNSREVLRNGVEARTAGNSGSQVRADAAADGMVSIGAVRSSGLTGSADSLNDKGKSLLNLFK